MKKFLSIIFCIGIIFCLISCQGDNSQKIEETETSSTSTNQTYVQDLNLAIKKTPTEYNGKEVTVKGYCFTRLDGHDVKYLADVCVVGAGNRYKFDKDGNKSRIKILITDEVLLTVLDHGDYIELTGTVTISNGEIYLDDCTYTMITPYEEME